MGGVQSTASTPCSPNNIPSRPKYEGLTWRIENFSSKSKKLQSEIFDVDGDAWRLVMYPKGNPHMNVVDHVSIYLHAADSAALPREWSRAVKFGLTIINQIDPEASITEVCEHEFNAKGMRSICGYPTFIPLIELFDHEEGYLKDDVCLVKVNISSDTTIDLKSEIETDLSSMGSSKVGKFTWRIENFSNIKETEFESDSFLVGGKKWRLTVYPKGHLTRNYFSIYVEVADSATLPHGWSRYAHIRLTVVNQIDRRTSITIDYEHEFKASETSWGYSSFMSLNKLLDPTRGYLVNDTCIIEVNISTDKTIDLLSQIETIEADNTSEEDMDTFFTSLESELVSTSFVSSQEKAMEALANIYEVLNMDPANFWDLGIVSSLKKAFKDLYSFDCYSMLKIEQKTELLAMEDKFKQLAEQAVKAMQDKKFLTEEESVKLKLSHKLEQSLIKFKKSKAEVKQAEQRIVAHLEQVDEAQKNKEKLLAEQMEIFKSSQNWKVQLNALGKEWPDYVGKAKVDEKEERTIETEWCKMKDFISSLKGNISKERFEGKKLTVITEYFS